jgi:hypothetical protein
VVVCDDAWLLSVISDGPEDDGNDDDGVRLCPSADVISESSSLAPAAREEQERMCVKEKSAGKFKAAVWSAAKSYLSPGRDALDVQSDGMLYIRAHVVVAAYYFPGKREEERKDNREREGEKFNGNSFARS